jgi:hypothetical protein
MDPLLKALMVCASVPIRGTKCTVKDNREEAKAVADNRVRMVERVMQASFPGLGD